MALEGHDKGNTFRVIWDTLTDHLKYTVYHRVIDAQGLVPQHRERIFLVGEGNRAALRLVRTGAIRGDRVEILSGLNAGERIILSPDATLRDGQPLEVQP